MTAKSRGGRPKLPDDRKVLKNGFFPLQWERLRKEAEAQGYADVMPYLRKIVNRHFASEDARESSSQENAASDRELEKSIP